MRISDWSSDVCSSDLGWFHRQWLAPVLLFLINVLVARWFNAVQMCRWTRARRSAESLRGAAISCDPGRVTSIETGRAFRRHDEDGSRSEEHTSELQSLMRISYAVFCLKNTKNI